MSKKTYPINIRFNDLDSMNHVNNAVYITYFEQARMEYFAEIIGLEWDWSSEGVLLARNEVDYKIPLLLHDDAKVEIWVSNVGTKSMEMSYRIIKKHKGEWVTCTVGKSVLVSFDYKNQKSILIPEKWKVAIGLEV